MSKITIKPKCLNYYSMVSKLYTSHIKTKRKKEGVKYNMRFFCNTTGMGTTVVQVQVLQVRLVPEPKRVRYNTVAYM